MYISNKNIDVYYIKNRRCPPANNDFFDKTNFCSDEETENYSVCVFAICLCGIEAGSIYNVTHFVNKLV